ncbi:MAG: XRE family transcriptional regulator [Sphingobacteriales bacterium]|nr:MAG: XRE family transcriptional regulator [Sphingobacteriales bacterium]
MDIYHIRNNIKLLRRSRGITQKEIAVKLFMDERTYSKIERGEKKSMDIRLLSSIADILETDVFTLLRSPSETEQPANLHTTVVVDDEMYSHIHTLQQTQMDMMHEIKHIEERISQLISMNQTTLHQLRQVHV